MSSGRSARPTSPADGEAVAGMEAETAASAPNLSRSRRVVRMAWLRSGSSRSLAPSPSRARMTEVPSSVGRAGSPDQPAGIAAVTTISTFQPGSASRDSTVARAGAMPGTTQASQARFMPSKSAMSAR